MSFIGEAVLSASVELLIEKLASQGLELVTRHKKLKADLIKWKGMLEMIQAVLAEAEDRQTKDESVKMWLDNLENLAYDAEDVFDELETEALRRELLLQEPAAADQPSSSAKTSKFRKLIPTCRKLISTCRKLISTCRTNFCSRSIQFESKMVLQIEEVTARLQDIERRKGLLDLKNVSSDGKSKINVGQRLPTTSLVNEDEVYGREKDKEAIVELLLRDDLRADDGFSVISIKGLGGVGKTTLAQLVYNDDRVQRHFEIKGWTCVSDDFDVFGVSKSILKSIAKDQSNNDGDLNSLQVKLKKQLSGKKFLFVLDDMWNENYNSWRALICPFGAGASGSKIVVTHRNQGVAETMRAVSTKTLKELSEDDCLCVLIQHSLGVRDFNIPQSLKEVAEKIAKKCKGLPLAAKLLGGLLSGKDDLNYWEFVLKTNIWDLPEDKCDIVPALRVSYHFLPPRLKRCFAYCSLFPKDHEFEEEEIILLWTAEGFLDQEYNGRKMEDLGREFVRELHSRSLFQQSSYDASRFVMHDLINDLARWAAGEICFRMEDTSAGENLQKFSQSLRHFSCSCGDYDGEKMLKSVSDVERLRTFLRVNLSDYRSNLIAWSVLQRLLHLPRLRVFSLRGYHISKLPNEIGNLKHLRFLNLSGTGIQILPESINSLYNLHSILLEGCYHLKKLCNDMGNLKKLRHLKNSNVPSLEEMPKGFGKLTCLLTLGRFVVGKDSGSGLRELKSLAHLQGRLQISKLENVKDVGDASEAPLYDKVNIEALSLQWSARSERCESETQVLSMLKPHPDVQELTITGYGGTKFPIWLGDSSFSKLVQLKFEGCGKCTSLPSVGQLPFLKELDISGMDGVVSVGSEFYGNSCSVPFPSLEALSFSDMTEWEEWNPCGAGQEVDEVFLKLRTLSLDNCCKLQGTLPERLPLLERLVIRSCDQLLVTIQCLPPLSELQIDGCKMVVFSRPHLEIVNVREQAYFWRSETRLPQDIRSLNRLQISRCPQLLSSVPQALLTLSSLTEMRIYHCTSLVSFPEAALPSQLRTVKIKDCYALESLPEAWMHNSNSSLESLEIRSCNSLVSFPEVALPSQLRTVVIKYCNALESLPELPASLEHLEVHSCSNLALLSRNGNLPQSLKCLRVAHCSKLESLVERLDNTSLEEITIGGLENLKSLPAGFHNLHQLQEITIWNCENLKALPNCMHNLTSLLNLAISWCPSVVSFPEDGFPTNLHSLVITDLKISKALFEWGLNRFTSLRRFKIWGGCPDLVSPPSFPTSLTELRILDMPNLESISSIGENLTSLETLELRNCPKLTDFPEQGLPKALLQLYIDDCPLIEERCRKDEGKYWPMISHIPRVMINGRSLFEGRPIN